jgi:cell division protein ZapA (FtsZ GTPase activity inhibitor)
MKKEGKRSSVEVELMGRKLPIKSEKGEEYIVKMVSDYVQKELEKVTKSNRISATSLDIPLLTAMNIAGTYFSEVNSQRILIDSLLDKVDNLIGYIDERLKN